jgi:hypothetical protein
MKNFINNISSDKLTIRGFFISLLLVLLTLAYIVLSYPKLPPFIPIFNQLPWGNERLASTPGIFIPIIIFSFVFMFNLAFTSIIYNKNPLIARMVAAVTLILALMNFLFIIKTIAQIT